MQVSKKLILIIGLCFLSMIMYSQDFFKPFKQGNEYVIKSMAEQGKTSRPFETIRPLKTCNYFIGYRRVGDKILSSCLKGADVIIADKHYCDFTYLGYNNILTKELRNIVGKETECYHIYDEKGNLLMDEYFLKVEFVYNLAYQAYDIKDYLVVVTHLNGQTSVLRLNNKDGAIGTPLISNLPNAVIEHPELSNSNFMRVFSRGTNGTSELYIISIKNREFSITSRQVYTEDVQLLNPPALEEPLSAPESYKTTIASWRDNQRIKQINRMIDPFTGTDTLFFTEEILDTHVFEMLHDKGKKGLLIKSSAFLAPIYDEIYQTKKYYYGPEEFCFEIVAKKDGLYNIYYFAGSDIYFSTKSLFKHFPVNEINQCKLMRNYMIVALYDDTGKFLHYANWNGTDLIID